MESFLLFRQSLLTLLTPTSDAPPLSPLSPLITAPPSVIESDENRLECDMTTLCLDDVERDSADAILRDVSLVSGGYRPKGSGGNGIIGELPLREGPGGEYGPFFSSNARVQMTDSEETTSFDERGLATVGFEAGADTPLKAKRGEGRIFTN
jgi:hypothetical protein